MKELLVQLARIADRHDISFGAFDPNSLFAGASFEFAFSVSEYFTTCVPSAKLDLDLFRIFSEVDIATQSQSFIPSRSCAPHGFITIATDSCGDAFSVDVTSGKVFHLSHEKYETDGIEPGWNANTTAFLPTLPVTRKNIIETSEGYWESISDFLQEVLDYAKENG